jgi:hypothetical protein
MREKLSTCAVLAALLAASMLAQTADYSDLRNSSEPVGAHPEWDAAYTAAIRAATTEPYFASDLVDHLPAGRNMPTPLSHLGYIAGAPDHLTYAKDIHAYLRALAQASPRVKVESIGTTEEGREMILVAIADEATIAKLDEYRAITQALADPRALTSTKARALIERGKPIYWLTGGLHSRETGAPEMLMELAYRLAVEDSPMVRAIRANVITLITPVLEVDGRERTVDLWRYYQKNPDVGMPPLAYWGTYVGHDNNRDMIGMNLALTRNTLGAFNRWRPQVFHDLHESVPFLYISTGTGPYNAWLDPLVVDEWWRMATHEVQVLTAKGMPGVWTQGFYDGWAPNFLFWVALGRNAIGRFYETFGNAVPSTEERVVRGTSDRAWFRPNPPLPKVRWSLRDNVNYQQSGALIALADMAANRTRSLELYWRLGERSIAKARTEGPAAYVFEAKQERKGQLRELLALLQRQGIEVHVAERGFSDTAAWPPAKAKAEETVAKATDPRAGQPIAGAKLPAAKANAPLTFSAGSFIVRLDQPVSRLADALLDTQFVRGDERVYDDTGWTLGLAYNVNCTRIVGTAILDVPMHLWDGKPAGKLTLAQPPAALAITARADLDLIRLLYAVPGERLLVAQQPFKDGRDFPVGTVLMAGAPPAVVKALADLDLEATQLAAMPAVPMHELRRPRIALVHSWPRTQDEGWYRLAFEHVGVPYTYVSTQAIAREADLGSRFDAIVFPPVGGDPAAIVHGMVPGTAVPWRRSELTPNLGVDSTDDMRPGLGFEGLLNLKRFVERGGVLIAAGDAARTLVEYGLARGVSVAQSEKIRAAGSLLRAIVKDPSSPVVWGYDGSLPVYFAGTRVWRVGISSLRGEGDSGGRPSGRGGKDDPDVPQGRPYVALPERPKPAPGEEGFQPSENMPHLQAPFQMRPADRPRVLLAFPEKPDELLLSGMLDGAAELAGKAVLVDAPLGRGHLLLFANNPMWRGNTIGSYALIFNAIANYQQLGLGWPPRPRNDTKAAEPRVP